MWEIIKFEIQYRLSRPATYIYIAITMIMAALAAYYIPGDSSTKMNSAYQLFMANDTINIILIFFVIAIMGVPLIRDVEHHTAQTYFSLPITKKDYLLGRFIGSFIVLTLILFSGTLATVGAHVFAFFKERPDYGTYEMLPVMNYLSAFFFHILLTAFSVGSIVFLIIAFTKKTNLIYVLGVFFITYVTVLSSIYMQHREWADVINLIDPFGSIALLNVTEFWSQVEKNKNAIPLNSPYGLNRLFWFSIAILCNLVVVFRFSFDHFLNEKTKKSADKEENIPENIEHVEIDYNGKTNWAIFTSLVKIEFNKLLKNNLLGIVFVLGLILAGIIYFLGQNMFDSPQLPLTKDMLSIVGIVTGMLGLGMIFVVGELYHEHRANGIHHYYDAFSHSNFLFVSSRVVALILFCLLLPIPTILIGMLLQTLKGYFNYEIGLYLLDMYCVFYPGIVGTVLFAFGVQLLARNKWVGHFINILVIMILPSLISFAFKSQSILIVPFSETKGFLTDFGWYNQFLVPKLISNLYWFLIALFTVFLGFLTWQRGFKTSFKENLTEINNRIRPKWILGTLVTVMCAVFVGNNIYQNTEVDNKQIKEEEYNSLLADVEKKWGHWFDKKGLKIVSLKAEVDLYPETVSWKSKAQFSMINPNPVPIDSMVLQMQYISDYAAIDSAFLAGKKMEPIWSNDTLKLNFYKLPQSVAPSDTVSLVIYTSDKPKGYALYPNFRITKNGYFIDQSIFPIMHLERALTSNGKRKKYDLDTIDFNAPIQTDHKGMEKNMFGPDADFMDMKVRLSTSKNHIAIAPGRLVKKEETESRNIFTYQTEKPNLFFFNFLSAEYEVKKDVWKGKNGEEVAIEIYYNPKHSYNLDHFIQASKDGLTYMTDNYGPYPDSVFRIVEYPGFGSFAQSFRTTIAYSEKIGFTGDYSDPSDFNVAYYITLHELAHQWWGHAITPSSNRGSNILSESLAEYSALMAIKKQSGDNGASVFLKKSLEKYLMSRFTSKGERSLADVERNAAVWYQKGSMIMYHLQDVIGEQKINTALKSLYDEHAYKGAPYATSFNLIDKLKEVTPDSLDYFIEDGFRKIVLYANKTESNKVTKNDTGYEVEFTVFAKKIELDKRGNELDSIATHPMLIEVGAFYEDGEDKIGRKAKKPIRVEKKWLKPGKNVIKWQLKDKPHHVGIDPYYKLIDRKIEDNIQLVD